VFLDQPAAPVALAAIDPGEASRRLSAFALTDHGLGDPALAAIAAIGSGAEGLFAEIVASSACMRLCGRPPASWFGAALGAARAG
jgi:hypothetical protein